MFCSFIFALSALALSNAESYDPLSTQEAWDNHFSAFGEQNVEQIAKDYNDQSSVKVYDYCTDATSEYNGQREVSALFEGLFAQLSDTSDLTVPALDVYENGVFLVWSAAASGFTQVTDTFIFDAATHAILQQNIVVYSAACDISGRRLQTLDGSWDNHFAAFGAQDLPRIIEDYTDASTIAVYNFHNNDMTYFTGLAAIESLFTGLFADLTDLTSLTAPVVDTAAVPIENTFLVWKCPDCSPAAPGSYALVTDTFVYGTPNAANGPAITRQNIVVFQLQETEGRMCEDDEECSSGEICECHDHARNLLFGKTLCHGICVAE